MLIPITNHQTYFPLVIIIIIATLHNQLDITSIAIRKAIIVNLIYFF